MNDAPASDGVAVSLGDVTITKAYQAEKFPVPAIEFVVESDRDDDVLVRVIDYPPETVSKDDLGFHPDFGADYWTVADDHIVFERTLGAGESYTTVYGIREVEGDGIEAFLAEPELVVVDSEADVEEVVGEDKSKVVREVLAGTSETVPGAESEDTDQEPIDVPEPEVGAETEEGEEDEPEPIDLEEPADPATAPEPAAADDPIDGEATPAARPSESDRSGPSVMPGSVAAALATEIRQGRVSGDDLDVLREELDIAERDDSKDVRINHLQSQVADLVAYTSALEEFIDENGPGRQLLDDLKNEFANVNDDLRDLNLDIESNERAISTLEDDSLELRDNIDDLDEDTATIRGDLATVEEDVLDVRGDVDELEDDVSRLDATIDDVVAQQEEQVAELAETHEERLDSLRAEQAALAETVAEIKEWRNQLAGVFGSGNGE
ncbi:MULTISPECIES: hypothetical protein [unclassified Haladaptatus]|uniref:hypothetical protein n=1 Tax=unclassified Haladaptatus TaxID=2622732 RepID=UPI0023E8B5A9|nr:MULTISPECIES: hypothetical protein [unclassified Haladaptatus]